MQRKPPQPIKRRDFLISTATLAGVGLPTLGLGASRPCPPSTLSVSGGGSTSSACQTTGAGQLPVLTLTSAASSGAHPWTFGHAFRKGDVPSGSYITADANSFQAEVRNRWSDGSVKFAVLSGISSFTQNQPKAVQLSAAGSAPTGGDVGEPTSLDVAVTFSGAVTGTYTLQSALGVNKEAWGGKGTAGRVRKIPGPVMSEFHYYVPTSDAHVSLWFFVRRYATGATEVETVIENGWLNVNSPGQRDYGINILVGGANRFNGSIAHLHHTRWSRSDWLGPDTSVTPAHDGEYLRATRLVPNYITSTPSSAAWVDNTNVDTWDAPLNEINPIPFARGNFSSSMGDYGYDEGIGLLPRWEALYVTSQHPVAYRSMVGNARCYGRYNLNYRDETTGKPFRFSQPNGNASLAASLGMNGTAAAIKYGFSDAPTTTPPPSGSAPPIYTPTHAPSVGYLAYLVTGRWVFLEQTQLASTAHWLLVQSSRGGASGVFQSAAGAMQTRGAAWSIRTLAHAACITPDADVLQSEYRSSLAANASWYAAQYIGGALANDLGMVANTTGWGDTRPWMNDFLASAVGWASDLDLVAEPAYLMAFRNWLYKSVTGRLSVAGYCFQDAAPYSLNMTGKSAWSEIYAAIFTGTVCTVGGALRGAYFPQGMQMSYWGNLMPALAYAVDHDAPGSGDAYSRLLSASNWPQGVAGYKDNPTWGVIPRA